MPTGLKIKLLYPKFLVIIFILAGYTPIRVANLDILFPSIDLMLIYYWCVYRPELLPNWFVFTAGIFKDILSGIPIGINALVNLILRTFTTYKRERYLKQPFIIIWQGFIIFSILALLSKWVVFSFINNEFINIKFGVIQTLITIATYPLFHCLFSSIYLILPKKHSNA